MRKKNNTYSHFTRFIGNYPQSMEKNLIHSWISTTFRTKEDIEQLSNILNNDKVMELASAVERVNPVQTSTSSTMDSEVFEI
jgi:hypothetical protein